MKIGSTWVIKSIGVLLACSTVACGKGFKSGDTVDSAAKQQVNIEDQLNQAEKATASAQAAMLLAQEAIGGILGANGNLNMNLFKKGGSGLLNIGGQMTSIADQLQPFFDKIYEQLVAVKSQYEVARKALTDAMSKLDANNPAHAAMIAQIQAQMSKLDSFENLYSMQLHRLARKLDLAVNALDKVSKGVTSFIPGFGWIADMLLDFLFLGDVKNMIFDFQQKLLLL